MRASITHGGNLITIDFDDENEQNQLFHSYKKKVRNIYAAKEKRWDGVVNLVINGRHLPVGLWKTLVDFCKRFGYPLYFDYKEIFNNDVTKEEVTVFCLELFSDHPEITPDKEQIDAVYKIIKFRYTLSDSSVRFGKTLVIYCVIKFLLAKNLSKKILIMSVNPSLIMQNYGDFLDYSCGKDSDIAMIHPGSKPYDYEKPVLISNFQYLANKPPEWFFQFDAFILDEAHRASAPTIKTIINNCKNVKLRAGVSGSIDEDNSADFYQLLAYFGPIVKEVTKRELISQNRATDGKIFIYKLDYLSLEERKVLYSYKELMDGEKVLREEELMYRKSEQRLRGICKLINEFQSNTLVYFKDVQGQYGLKIVNRLKEISENKIIMYIDESISQTKREEFKKIMEENNNCILVASYDCFSTGETVKNLHNIVCAEPTKDRKRLSQALGRPMSLHEEKLMFYWFDIVDDFSVMIDTPEGMKKHQNYGLKWMKERIKLYNEDSFPYEIKTVKFGERISNKSII